MVKWIKKYLICVLASFMLFLSVVMFGVTKPKEKENVKLDETK